MQYPWFHYFCPRLTAVWGGILALVRLCPAAAEESAVVTRLPWITPVSAYVYESGTPALLALTLPAPLPQETSAGLLWAGSWSLSGIRMDKDDGFSAGSGHLVNRGDFKVMALGLTARFQTLDKRPAFFWEQVDAGITAFSGGLYHNSTGSRFLYGIIDEWGLSARLKNPWGKSVPFVETRRPMTADLKTEPSTTGENEAYLYLRSPWPGKLRAFASIQAGGPEVPAVGGGMDVQFTKKTNFRAEGFYTERHLAASSPSSWFAFPPPLPERDYRFAGIGLFFTSPLFGAAVDGAYSETFAWGRDLYGNLALRLGNKPWQLSLEVDAAGSRFVDRGGGAAEAGFRTAVRIDRKGKRASLLRIGFTLRGPEIGEPFDRGSGTVSYRFPSSIIFPLPLGVSFRPGTVSLTAARDGRNKEKILDSIDTGVSLYLGPVRAAFNTSLDCVTDTDSYDFNSFKISGELSYYTGPFQFRAKAGYTERYSRPPVWDASWYMAIRGKPGRFSVKVSSPDFPEKWECVLSWRLELQIGKR